MKGEVRKRRSDGLAMRAEILDAAAGEFAGKGYELASVRAVCARAGVTDAEWAVRVRDHICRTIFDTPSYDPGEGNRR